MATAATVVVVAKRLKSNPSLAVCARARVCVRRVHNASDAKMCCALSAYRICFFLLFYCPSPLLVAFDIWSSARCRCTQSPKRNVALCVAFFGSYFIETNGLFDCVFVVFVRYSRARRTTTGQTNGRTDGRWLRKGRKKKKHQHFGSTWMKCDSIERKCLIIRWVCQTDSGDINHLIRRKGEGETSEQERERAKGMRWQRKLKN